MPGTRVGLDPISRGPLQLRRRGHRALDPRIDHVTSQTKAGRARLIDHHCRRRQRPDPVTNFFAARCQPPLKNLTGFSVQSTPDHRSCVHIQPDARTMTFHWGLLHLWLYRPGPDSCRQPTFTCSEAPASSYRLQYGTRWPRSQGVEAILTVIAPHPGGNPLKLWMPAAPALVRDENGPGRRVDVATDWCHEPVLTLDAGPPAGTRGCCCGHVSAPL